MKITFAKSAEKEIFVLDRNLGKRIFKKINLLSKNPFGLGSKKLAGGKGFRIRIGDYRVVYMIDAKKKEAVIIKIRHRREVYK